MTTGIVQGITDEQIAVLVCECRQGADDHAGMGHEFDANLFDRLADALADLSARLRDAERDAERYRWLCNGNGYFMEENMLCHLSNDKDDADAAIDAAMAEDGMPNV
jgi:hypothetical protein